MAKVNVRYIVNDVDKSIAFYERLGFLVEIRPGPGFAIISKGYLQLLLTQPGVGGAGQAMPDGKMPAPGGWNRIQVEVADLKATMERLQRVRCRFRNEIVEGRGGKQVIVDDPSGNPVELFEPG